MGLGKTLDQVECTLLNSLQSYYRWLNNISLITSPLIMGGSTHLIMGGLITAYYYGWLNNSLITLHLIMGGLITSGLITILLWVA